MSKLLKKSLIAGASLLMLASVGAGTSNVNARRYHHHHIRTHRVYRHHSHAVVPARYRHTYYGGYRGNHMIYRIHANYAYFTDNVRAHHKHHWIRYRLARGRHGWYRTINNSVMATQFKGEGNHIRILYDVRYINMYR